jgi:hypothetical protein
MKQQAALVFGLLITASCWAQEVPLYFEETARLDRILALTGSHSQTSATALELLQLVALGRTSAIRAGTETQVGLARGELQHPRFAQPSVRVRAIRNIGECDLPEALEFLKNLKRADLGEDTTQMIWPNARLALRSALLRRIADSQAKIEFLVNTLTEQGDGRGLVAYWAANLLCDQGTSTALPLIRRSFTNSWSGQRGEDAIKFCETRMQVVSRDPDRVKALASVLTIDGAAVSDELLQWTVYQLDSMHSPSADAELDHFANELGKLREGSPQYGRFWELRQELRRFRERRAK